MTQGVPNNDLSPVPKEYMGTFFAFDHSFVPVHQNILIFLSMKIDLEDHFL